MLVDWKAIFMLIEMALWIGSAFYLKARLKQYIYKPGNSIYYLPPCSVGTTYEYYMEIKNRKINR